ncbi:MAG: hypothetical protein WD273_04530 [Trueperaceae bacterium]
MELALVPLMGPFHLRSPAYNTVTVRDMVAAWAPDALATTALSAGDLSDPQWQDTLEIALPLSVVPWTRRMGLPLHLIGEASGEPGAQEDFRRYLQPYPELRQKLAEVDALLGPVSALLEEPLTIQRITGSLLPALAHYQQAREATFEDGPASEWLHERMKVAAGRAVDLASAPAAGQGDGPDVGQGAGQGAVPGTVRRAKRDVEPAIERLALLAPVDHLPYLTQALEDAGATPVTPSPVAVTPEARERSLLDYSFRVDTPEPTRLLEQLRELDGAEARYHEANLLLASGHGFEALELLERASHGDFSFPYFLPGYLLARLGQLRDLGSRRDDALRAYRGVLALDYAPAEALEVARSGLERPFSP